MNLLTHGRPEQRRHLLEALGLPCFLIDARQQEFYLDTMNLRCVTLYGFDQRYENTLIDNRLLQQIFPDDHQTSYYESRLFSILRRTLETGRSERQELMTQTASRKLWTRNSYVPLTIDGVPSKVLVTVTDISEKMNAILANERVMVDLLGEHVDLCNGCRKIRQADGSWQTAHQYMHSHPDLSFTHGICPECLHREYHA